MTAQRRPAKEARHWPTVSAAVITGSTSPRPPRWHGLALAALTQPPAAASGHGQRRGRRRRSPTPAPSSASRTCGAAPGPDAFDCSGLVMQAYAAAGITIPRTSQQQWAGPHARSASARPGDLVFFAGVRRHGDGTRPCRPGHRHGAPMIEAYATGYPVRISAYGTASSPAGDQDPAGFTDPAAR